MDTDEGTQTDPLGLHKYLYCEANPANHMDPSGHDLADVLVSVGIGATIGGLSAGVNAEAQGRVVTLQEVLIGAGVGGVLGPLGVAFPGFAAGASAFGAGYGVGAFGPILLSPNATYNQKVASATMIVTALWGVNMGFRYATAVQNAGAQPPSANVPVPPPQFPLEVQAPPGVDVESMQSGLDAQKFDQIPQLLEDMAAGKPVRNVPSEYGSTPKDRSAIPTIGGYKSGNRYIISEGNHRMTAALMFYAKTGNPKYINDFLSTGSWDQGSPSTTYKMTQP